MTNNLTQNLLPTVNINDRWACRTCAVASVDLRPCDFRMSKLLAMLQTYQCMYGFDIRYNLLHLVFLSLFLNKLPWWLSQTTINYWYLWLYFLYGCHLNFAALVFLVNFMFFNLVILLFDSFYYMWELEIGKSNDICWNAMWNDITCFFLWLGNKT